MKIKVNTNIFLREKIELKYDKVSNKVAWIEVGDTTIYFAGDGEEIIADITDQLIDILENLQIGDE